MSDDNLKPHNGEEILFKPSLAGMEISRLMNLVNTKDDELQKLRQQIKNANYNSSKFCSEIQKLSEENGALHRQIESLKNLASVAIKEYEATSIQILIPPFNELPKVGQLVCVILKDPENYNFIGTVESVSAEKIQLFANGFRPFHWMNAIGKIVCLPSALLDGRRGE